MAGPCSVENEKQLLTTAVAVKAAGATILRGGAFKPRTSPYSFQGLEEESLKFLAMAREKTGLPFVTEVVNTQDVDIVAEYADMLQIGARNMQNFALLKAVGKKEKLCSNDTVQELVDCDVMPRGCQFFYGERCNVGTLRFHFRKCSHKGHPPKNRIFCLVYGCPLQLAF